jgi:SAM-dependent methyltransferase
VDGSALAPISAIEAYERYIVHSLLGPWALDLVSRANSLRSGHYLDLACGTGIVCRTLAAACTLSGKVDGLDISPGMLAKADALTEELPEQGWILEWHEGCACAMPFRDEAFDQVLCQQGLQFFPDPLLALREIHRVLVPGGLLYVSEPVYWGDFNAIMCLIDDERLVREAAFEALRHAVDAGLFELVQEVFFESEGIYPDWESFAARFIDVTHRERHLDAARLAEIRAAFERHLAPQGVRLWKPHRVDLLQRID